MIGISLTEDFNEVVWAVSRNNYDWLTVIIGLDLDAFGPVVKTQLLFTFERKQSIPLTDDNRYCKVVFDHYY